MQMVHYILSLYTPLNLYNIGILLSKLHVFILTHPVNFPCGRKPEHLEKTHDFRQSVDRLFSHESVARIEPTNSEMKGVSSDDCPIIYIKKSLSM
jgi:hypothetical protein